MKNLKMYLFCAITQIVVFTVLLTLPLDSKAQDKGVPRADSPTGINNNSVESSKSVGTPKNKGDTNGKGMASTLNEDGTVTNDPTHTQDDTNLWIASACLAGVVAIIGILSFLQFLFIKEELKSLKSSPKQQPLQKMSSPNQINELSDIQKMLKKINDSMPSKTTVLNIWNYIEDIQRDRPRVKDAKDQIESIISVINENTGKIELEAKKSLGPIESKLELIPKMIREVHDSINSDINKHIKDAIDKYYTPEENRQALDKLLADRGLLEYLESKDKELNRVTKERDSIQKAKDELDGKYQDLENKLQNLEQDKAEIKKDADKVPGLEEKIVKNDEKYSIELKKLEAEISRKAEIISNEKENCKKMSNEIEKIKNEMNKLISDQGIYDKFFPKGDFNMLIEIFGSDASEETILSFFALRSQANRNSDKIRSSFSRLDEILFETFSVDIDKLTQFRSQLQGYLNENVLKDIYRIEWPEPGAKFNDDIHSREDRGNKIIIAKTAVVYDAKLNAVITKARVKTG